MDRNHLQQPIAANNQYDNNYAQPEQNNYYQPQQTQQNNYYNNNNGNNNYQQNQYVQQQQQQQYQQQNQYPQQQQYNQSQYSQYSQSQQTYYTDQSQQSVTYITPSQTPAKQEYQVVVYANNEDSNKASTYSNSSVPQYITPEQFANLKDEFEDSDMYQVPLILRFFYIIKLLITMFFIAFLSYCVWSKQNTTFNVYSKYSTSTSTTTGSTYDYNYEYYLGKSQLEAFKCSKLDFEYYGDLIASKQGYYIVPLILVFIWKIYYLYFQGLEVWKGSIQGKYTYQFRNEIRQRDTYNFIIDWTSSIALSPYIAFMFTEESCASWRMGQKNYVFSPNFFYLNSFVWCTAVFCSLIGFMVKREEGYNLRPVGMIMLIPMLTYRVFSFCTNYQISPSVYRVTTYYYRPWSGHSYETEHTEVNNHYFARCLCRVIGLLGQFLLPFYEIVGMILQLPYMLYYTPIYLIVYYSFAIAIFAITIQVHKRLGF